MKISNKKKTILCLFIILMLSLTGCKPPVNYVFEMKNNFYSQALAVDKATSETNKVRLTVIGKNLSGTGANPNNQSQEVRHFVLSAEGKTIFEANRNFHSFNYRDVFFGHNSYLLISEEVAKENLAETLDFFMRNNESRTGMLVFIVKGIRAEKILYSKNTSSKFAPDLIRNLVASIGGLSFSKEIKLYEILGQLYKKYCSVLIPCLEMKSDDADIELNGMAVIKNESLLGFIMREKARGVNWVTGDVKSCVLVAKDETGDDISLDVLNSDSKIEFDFQDNKFLAKVNINFLTSINEQHSKVNIYYGNGIEKVVDSQNSIVKKEAEEAISYAKSQGADIFGIGDSLYHKEPLKWEEIKDDWENIFSNMTIDIQVKSNVSSTGMIEFPIGCNEVENVPYFVETRKK